jgi:ATP-dependent RNA helicase RhlE
MKKFSELPLCALLQSNLMQHGFVQPTPVQSEAIPPALAGRDVVATAQTGTGKTLAFLLPVIQSFAKTDGQPAAGIRALILVPTRELALQIHDCARQLMHGLNLRSAVVVGGMNETTQLRGIRQGAQIVIATPGRLCDFLNRKLIELGNVGVLVLDEADRMLDMGFLPALQQILKRVPERRQTLLFSATVEKSVAHLIGAHVNHPVRVAIGAPAKPMDGIDLHVYEVEQDAKLGLLENLLQQEAGSFLVFARTKHGTDRLARRLSASGFHAARIHGDRTQGQRNQALAGFKKGDYRILVATDVAARGIHVDAIAHVVNYDLPRAPEDFIHRVGRTGRAGARGTASTFATRGERGQVRMIEAAMQTRLTPIQATSGELSREKKRTPLRSTDPEPQGNAAPFRHSQTRLAVPGSRFRSRSRSKAR